MSELVALPCNACGGIDVTPFCHHEKYGLPLTAVMCNHCGLMFINPRPSNHQYALLNQADYRRAAVGTDSGLDHIYKKQYRHAVRTMMPMIIEHLASSPASLLDIGCCNGGTMAAWQQHYSSLLTYGVEPVIRVAADAARRTGRPVFQGLFENYKTENKFDLIICAQTLNHTLDPRENLIKIKSLLTPNGLLFISLYDAISAVLNRPVNEMVEIMHPYMFNDECLRYLLATTGFQIVSIKSRLHDGKKLGPRDIPHLMTARILIVARPGLSQAAVCPPDTTDILKRFQNNQDFYERWAQQIENWRCPNIWRRVYRRFNQTLT